MRRKDFAVTILISLLFYSCENEKHKSDDHIGTFKLNVSETLTVGKKSEFYIERTDLESKEFTVILGKYDSEYNLKDSSSLMYVSSQGSEAIFYVRPESVNDTIIRGIIKDYKILHDGSKYDYVLFFTKKFKVLPPDKKGTINYEENVRNSPLHHYILDFPETLHVEKPSKLVINATKPKLKNFRVHLGDYDENYFLNDSTNLIYIQGKDSIASFYFEPNSLQDTLLRGIIMEYESYSDDYVRTISFGFEKKFMVLPNNPPIDSTLSFSETVLQPLGQKKWVKKRSGEVSDFGMDCKK
ncbi:MAG: hypothetical protein AAGI07_06770 [Bacteroidota bacterium]